MIINLCRFVLLPLLTLSTLCACSSGPPKCDDKEVISKVIEYITPQLKSFLSKSFEENHGLKVSEYKEIYDREKKDNPYSIKVLAYENTVRKMDKMDIHLENIRADSIDKSVNKTICKASVKEGSFSFSNTLIYIATITTDGNLIVEVR